MDKKVEIAVKALDSKKAVEITALEIGSLTVVADYFVIAAGTSNTQVRALADEVEYQLGLEGIEPRQIEGKAPSRMVSCHIVVYSRIFSCESSARDIMAISRALII